jgi:hypothetical protein
VIRVRSSSKVVAAVAVAAAMATEAVPAALLTMTKTVKAAVAMA